MLRFAESLLDPTARPPEEPPAPEALSGPAPAVGGRNSTGSGLFRFYLAFHPAGALARRRAVRPWRDDRCAGCLDPRLHRPHRHAGVHPHAGDAAGTTPGRNSPSWPAVLLLARPAVFLSYARHHQPDGQSRPDEHDPLAEPLARGAAELDVLPERFRRPHRQPRHADRAGAAREPGDDVRRRLVHRRLRQQRRCCCSAVDRLAADAADPGVVRRLRRACCATFVPRHARTLAPRVGDALATSPAAWWTATPTS